MCRRYSAARFAIGALVALVMGIAGCQTVESESTDYQPTTEKTTQSFLDSRLEVLERRVEEYPKRHEFHYQVAGIHFQKREFRSCVTALHRALDLAPNESKYHYQMGRTYLQMGELASAQEHFRDAADNVTENRYTGPRVALGYTLAKQGHIDEAIREFEKCIEIEAENPQFYYFLGSLHDIRGDTEEVIHYYREYLVRGGTRYRKKALFLLERLGVPVENLPAGSSEFPESDLLPSFPGGLREADSDQNGDD